VRSAGKANRKHNRPGDRQRFGGYLKSVRRYDFEGRMQRSFYIMMSFLPLQIPIHKKSREHNTRSIK
jgi:hypothetical protein